MIGGGYWLIFTYRGCCNYGNYSWKLNIARLRIRVTRKERKYSLIIPFWFEIRVDILDCEVEMSFGKRFSSQIKSNKREAYFWLASRFMNGCIR